MKSRIKEARKSAGITQEEMSKLFGMNNRKLGNGRTETSKIC